MWNQEMEWNIQEHWRRADCVNRNGWKYGTCFDGKPGGSDRSARTLEKKLFRLRGGSGVCVESSC
ncbi:hypothetical protein [Paludifilum halophilum]|uniref:Uncharacterized protein n=1 Tax=Paludifilum halophilum TaxID=1642702 RepID=A0A235B5G3_9BACL|nr:hypothetical protein [Paludifilum halophilum]OYD07219.1 hypothetical protein CHM34_12610 [Paludifilum halophilum]